MEAIRRYLFSLCAAALLCSLVRALVPKGRMKSICSLLCGVFLAMTALSGLAGWQLTDVAEELTKMRIAAEEARTGVEIRNREALSAIIKSKTEAYIWDKAQELGLSVSRISVSRRRADFGAVYRDAEAESRAVHRRKPCHREGAADLDERIRTPDFKKWGLKLRRVIETWRLPLLILALGALILLWPSGKKDEPSAEKPEAAQTEETADTQTRLEQLLSSIDGVGRVELMLTPSGSEEIFYQTDTRVSGDTREETTVFSSTQSTQKTPVVTKTKSAPYLGAVVVCDGADSAAVQLRVMQAVSALTGLGSDKISVIKMKRQ